MNRALLEALNALAGDVYCDAMRRHPGLFAITGVEDQTDDDRAVLPVLVCLDELFVALDNALHPRPPLVVPPLPDLEDDDDIPF